MSSVQELVKVNNTEVPHRYIRRNTALDHEDHYSDDSNTSFNLPIINIESLLSRESVLADSELEKLHSACIDWGFFQIVNHGISFSLIETIKLEVGKLFQLPLEQKKKLWQNPGEKEGFGPSFVVSEGEKLDWSDKFSMYTLPTKIRKPHLFLGIPFPLREALEAYSLGLKNLTVMLLGQMAKALKMDSDEMRELFNDCFQIMRFNYYPPCPKSQQVFGLSPHSDSTALTFLLQLNETDGLQIRKDGKWLPVKPIPDAFVVNIGDMIEILSNGVYTSIDHRAVVSSTKERLSFATFHSINLDAEVGPALSLIDPPHKPALFRRETVEKYFKNFFAHKPYGKSNLDYMRIENELGD